MVIYHRKKLGHLNIGQIIGYNKSGMKNLKSFWIIKNLKMPWFCHQYFWINVDVNSIGIIGDINDDNRIITEYSDILY